MTRHCLSAVMDLVYLGLRLLFPALARAIACACLGDLPALISRRMFSEITSCDLPRFNGITPFLYICQQTKAISGCPAFIGINRWHPCFTNKRLNGVAVDAGIAEMPQARQVHIVC